MFSLQLKYEGFPPQKRLWNEALKQVFEEVGREWHQQFYEHHFTHEGAAEYGYTKRKGELQASGSKAYRRSYTGQKERKFGHTLPLRFTSTAYHIGKVAVVRATSKEGKVVLPSVFNFKHPRSQIDMRDEATAILPREVAHLQRFADRRLQSKPDAMRHLRPAA